MSKKADPLQFPILPNETTAGPGYAATISPHLVDKTQWVVLSRDADGSERAKVHRESKALPAYNSRDWYRRRSDGRWEYMRKDADKFEPSTPPDGAYCNVIEGIAFYTLHRMSPQEIEEHRANLGKLLDLA